MFRSARQVFDGSEDVFLHPWSGTVDRQISQRKYRGDMTHGSIEVLDMEGLRIAFVQLGRERVRVVKRLAVSTG